MDATPDKAYDAARSRRAGRGKIFDSILDTIGDTPLVRLPRLSAALKPKGEVVAKDLDELHKSPNITKQTALTEKGAVVNGRGDTPNMHDILSGSTPEGRAFPADKDMTCGNWTKSGDGSAVVGHHDRQGLNDSNEAKSWNSSHPSRGCSQDALKGTGGNGFFYCFAAN